MKKLYGINLVPTENGWSIAATYIDHAKQLSGKYDGSTYTYKNYVCEGDMLDIARILVGITMEVK